MYGGRLLTAIGLIRHARPGGFCRLKGRVTVPTPRVWDGGAIVRPREVLESLRGPPASASLLGLLLLVLRLLLNRFDQIADPIPVRVPPMYHHPLRHPVRRHFLHLLVYSRLPFPIHLVQTTERQERS